jgi:hypothetical protein
MLLPTVPGILWARHPQLGLPQEWKLSSVRWGGLDGLFCAGVEIQGFSSYLRQILKNSSVYCLPCLPVPEVLACIGYSSTHGSVPGLSSKQCRKSPSQVHSILKIHPSQLLKFCFLFSSLCYFGLDFHFQ